MTLLASARQQWLANPRRDLLAGTVVALALIPEAIAFSIIAGVDPAVGLYASFIIAVTIAFVGGRPAMISAATGAMALLMVTLVRDHGLEYLFAASLLCGVFQIIVGLLKLGRYIKFVSRSVMTGFVNSLAILIFLAQMPELIGANWQTFAMVGGGSGDHLRPAADHQGRALALGRHRCAQRFWRSAWAGRPHRGRHGRDALDPARCSTCRPCP